MNINSYIKKNFNFWVSQHFTFSFSGISDFKREDVRKPNGGKVVRLKDRVMKLTLDISCVSQKVGKVRRDVYIENKKHRNCKKAGDM